MKLAQFMEMFQKELGLDKPIPQSDLGEYVIHMDKDLSYTIIDLNPGIGIHCDVVPCPKEGLERFYTEVMHANLFSQGTEGALLGLSDDGNTLTLSREVEYNVDYEQFKAVLEDFMNAIDFWHSEASTSVSE